MGRAGVPVIIPDRIAVGLPCAPEGPPAADLIEVGGGLSELPDVRALRTIAEGRILTLLAWHVLTHRRTDPRYRTMLTQIPDHAAVGHFERSRWTDEAWEKTDALARAADAQAVVFQTPASFRASAEHAMRLENFVAHATRPGLALAWEWEPGSWPSAKALALCERIGAVPVIDPAEDAIPDGGEFVYLRFRGGRSGRKALRDDDIKKAALAVRDRIGWVVFANQSGAQDAARFEAMI